MFFATCDANGVISVGPFATESEAIAACRQDAIDGAETGAEDYLGEVWGATDSGVVYARLAAMGWKGENVSGHHGRIDHNSPAPELIDDWVLWETT